MGTFLLYRRQFIHINWIKRDSRSFLGVSVVGSLPCSAGDMDQIPGRGTGILHAADQLSLYTAIAECACHIWKAHGPQWKFSHDAMRILHATTKTQHSQNKYFKTRRGVVMHGFLSLFHHKYLLYVVIYLAATGLSCNMWDLLSCCLWDLVPWPGIEPGPPALGAQSLSHWTTREVPPNILKLSPKTTFIYTNIYIWMQHI